LFTNLACNHRRKPPLERPGWAGQRYAGARYGFAHLPHPIAGTVEVLLGVVTAPRLTLADYLDFLFWSTTGNILGGVVFVALLKDSHVVRTGEV